MKRWIYTYEYVGGDAGALGRALVRRSTDLLRSATLPVKDEGVDGDGTFLLELEGDLAGLHIAKQVRLSTGVARHDRNRVVIPLTWHAEPARRLFPRFTGDLEWEPLAGDLGQLTIAGAYDTPLGVLGGALDATLLRDLAHGTARQLITALARELPRQAEAPPRTEHPAGPKRGPLLVRDVMTSDPVVLDESLPMRTGALILFHAEVGGAPVVRADGSLVGVFSEADLLAKEADQRFGLGQSAAAEDRRRWARTVGEACSSPARVTAPDARLAAAAREMIDRRVSRLVVVGEGRIAGIVTRHDVLAALLRDDRDLLAAIRQELDGHGLGGITARVEWGQVVLSGGTPRRSDVMTAARLVERIDGVLGVDAELVAWDEDDVVRALPAPM